MGYTHYVERPVTNSGTPEMFGRLALDAKTICGQSGVPLAGWDGTGEPEFTESYFRFNGKGDTDSYETFSWQAVPEQKEHRRGQPMTSDFCKTEHKPYDAVICAILIRAKMIYGDLVDIYSDGDWGSGDWQNGIALYSRVAFAQGWAERDAVCPFTEVSPIA